MCMCLYVRESERESKSALESSALFNCVTVVRLGPPFQQTSTEEDVENGERTIDHPVKSPTVFS